MDELLARVQRAGHHGPIVLRADSGFENHRLMRTLQTRGVEFSIAVKNSGAIKRLIAEIPEDAWIAVSDYPAEGEAQVAEIAFKTWRLIVRRTRLTDQAQAELWPDWRHHCLLTNPMRLTSRQRSRRFST